MLLIPLQAVPAQTVTVRLNDQVCQLNVYQKFFGLFCDISVNNTLIIGGVICLDRNRIKRSVYLDFDGDLAFIDTQGTQNPDYTGLGPDGRYRFVYLNDEDLEVLGLLEQA